MKREIDVELASDGRAAILMEPEELPRFFLFHLVGMLVYQIDTLEMSMATLLSLDDLKNERVPRSAVQRKALEYLKDPMGDKVTEFRSRRLINAELGQRLNQAVKERNQLMHLFFSERWSEMRSAAGQARLMQELGSAMERFADLQSDLAQATVLSDVITVLDDAPPEAIRALQEPLGELVGGVVKASRKIPRRPSSSTASSRSRKRTHRRK